jgi:hypothetical protein
MEAVEIASAAYVKGVVELPGGVVDTCWSLL